MTCTHSSLRNGMTCDEYRAPMLWCATCRPLLAATRGIDVSRWPEWRYLDPASTDQEQSGENPR